MHVNRLVYIGANVPGAKTTLKKEHAVNLQFTIIAETE